MVEGRVGIERVEKTSERATSKPGWFALVYFRINEETSRGSGLLVAVVRQTAIREDRDARFRGRSLRARQRGRRARGWTSDVPGTRNAIPASRVVTVGMAIVAVCPTLPRTTERTASRVRICCDYEPRFGGENITTSAVSFLAAICSDSFGPGVSRRRAMHLESSQQQLFGWLLRLQGRFPPISSAYVSGS